MILSHTGEIKMSVAAVRAHKDCCLEARLREAEVTFLMPDDAEVAVRRATLRVQRDHKLQEKGGERKKEMKL